MIHGSRSPALAAGLIALACATGLNARTARAQVVYAQPYAPTYTYASPRTTTYANPGVVPGFAPRGGIGTTPFLGNTRGLGAYSYNYDRPVARTNNRRMFRGRR